MRKRHLYIFGDSFSAPWGKTNLNRHQWLKVYLDKEIEAGIEEIQDLEYWMNNKLNGSFEISNYAECGISNDTIFQKIYENYKDIKPGDFVIIQCTALTRVRAANVNDGTWMELHTPPVKGTEQHIIHHTNFTPSEIVKIGMDRLEKQYLDYFLIKLNMVREAFKQKQVRTCMTTFDSKLYPMSDIPTIFQKDNYATFFDRFNELIDLHPCFHGQFVIADEYVKFMKLGGYLDD